MFHNPQKITRMNHTELYIYTCTQVFYYFCFTSMSSAKYNILETILLASPHVLYRDYTVPLLTVQSNDPLTGIASIGTGHSQAFFSLSCLWIQLATFSEVSVIMHSEVDYYNSISYPQGHLFSHPPLTELAVPQRKTDTTFCSWSLQGRVQICCEVLFQSENALSHTWQQKDYLATFLSEVFKIINMLCNTWVMS